MPAALLGLGMFTIPESTRWLTKKGRDEEAWESLKWIRADDSQTVIDEMTEIRLGVEAESRAVAGFQFKGCPRPSASFVQLRLLISLEQNFCKGIISSVLL